MPQKTSRRELFRQLGIGAAALPLLGNLPSLGSPLPAAAGAQARKQRLIIVFSPNGVVPWNFWPESEGADFEFKESLKPLEPFRDQTLIVKGICDKVRGAGSAHMRGIGCLLTGTELLPGNQQGGSGAGAGWSSGISIDQELRKYLQANPETRTRFGSLEFGVDVPETANVWTRMSYLGANEPVTPISDPYQMFSKLYGQVKNQQLIGSVLDDVSADFEKLQQAVSSEDRQLLERHASLIRDMERELQAASSENAEVLKTPEIQPGVPADDIPRISRMQIDLLVHSLTADYARVATLQFSRATSQSRLKWLGFDDPHHGLSHEPDSNEEAQQKLTQINHWYCEQVAYLAKRLAETPEPGGDGSLLDNTVVLWSNELGKGNNHTMNDLPCVMVGGGLGFRTGRFLDHPHVHHNRLLLTLAHAFGHELKTFGNPDFCGDGPLTGLA
ncbi:DUF1552 domain-containing protein [Candidatus Laterigemmans baculatus]|uniref:DUF1552 domain-containing protein n=1 Tax=Candidatus Laterigemmans baculatus TaxID=2770505 RepID=UPI0013DAFA75|nr:DUF1552 domain-containing protein [Candidatus Laterigemmans baculatus]